MKRGFAKMVAVFLLVSSVLFPKLSFGQATILISQGGSVAVNNGDMFYDAGGAAGSDGSTNYTITLTPSVTGEAVCVDFTYFKSSGTLNIYDGTTISANNIGSLKGDYSIDYNANGSTPYGTGQKNVGSMPDVLRPGIFCANNASGALTLEFKGSGSNPGWVGLVTTYVKVNIGCTVDITASPTTACSGSAISLNANGLLGVPVLSNDFNASTIGAGWTSTPSVSFLSVLTCEPNRLYTTKNTDNSIYVWMQSAAAPRSLETNAFDVNNGGYLSYDYRMASDDDGGNGCEAPDDGEGTYVQYSTDNGSTWQNLKLMFPGVETALFGGGSIGCGNYVYEWNTTTIPLPVAAKSANTKFRWYQNSATSSNQDSWGVDNVVITKYATATLTITDLSTSTIVVSTTNIDTTITVYPTSSRSYRATLTDGGSNSCTKDVAITVNTCACVPPSITTQPTPKSICSGTNTTFAVVATGGSGYQWEVNTGSGWANVANGGVYSGATSATLTITGATSGMNTYQYRCKVLESVGTCPTTSTAVALTITPGVFINYAGSPYLNSDTAHKAVTVSGGVVTGKYTATPAGLSLDSTSGAIIPYHSAPGTYVVTVPSACGPISDTVVISVVCQDYQIQMYSDGTLGTKITKTTFGCTDAGVYLGPETFPDNFSFNAGLPYTDLYITITSISGSLDNLTLFRYNSSGVKVETLTANTGLNNNFFLRPTGCKYSVKTTDGSNGTYAYVIINPITKAVLASGTWTVTSGAESAQTILVTPTGTASYSGTGVTNGFDPAGGDDYTDDRGLGFFDPATAGAGTHQIIYSWNNNLPAPNNCIQTDTITVTVTGPPAPSVTGKSICYGTDTTLTATGGTLYKWYSAATGGTSIFTGATYSTPVLTANTDYWVTNTVGGCESARTKVTVTINALPTVSVNDATACAGLNASVTATPGAVATYSYAWTVPGGATAPGNVANFNATVAGSYSVIITNTTTTCVSLSDTGVVTINPLPTVTVNSPTVCGGQNASVVATPGTAATYSYAWTVPSGATAPGNVANFNASVGGSYSVVITNTTTNCVSASGSGTVTISSTPTVSVNSPSACAGQNASVVATPGTAATYSYAWTVPSGATNPGSVDTFNATVAGSYSVIITNTTTTCVSISASGTVTINPLPTVTVNSPTVCAGTNASLTATPGTAATYSYVWTVPSGATDPGNVNTFNAPVGGTYSVVITNTATTCVSASGSGVVTNNPLPTIQIQSNIASGCEPLRVNFSAITSPLAQSISWNFGNGTSSTTTAPNALYSNDGLFDVSADVTDVNGCQSDTTEVGFITVYPKPVVDFTFSPSQGMVNEAVTFTSSYTQTPGTWMWAFGDGNTQSNPVSVANYTYIASRTYTVTHIVQTDMGCKDTASKDIVVVAKIIVPNVLTPNNDGFNDTFIIDGLQFVEGAKMKIYNRWGKKVFESDNYKSEWDGGSCSEGVYFYVLTVPDFLGAGPYSGSVTLFRE